jgi:hypothetical protein
VVTLNLATLENRRRRFFSLAPGTFGVIRYAQVGLSPKTPIDTGSRPNITLLSPGAICQPACLHGVTTPPQLILGAPLLLDALHFILETLIVGISLFRAYEMQDPEHIVGDTLVQVPQISDIPSPILGGASAYLPHSPRLSFTTTARCCSEPRYRSVV